MGTEITPRIRICSSTTTAMLTLRVNYTHCGVGMQVSVGRPTPPPLLHIPQGGVARNMRAHCNTIAFDTSADAVTQH